VLSIFLVVWVALGAGIAAAVSVRRQANLYVGEDLHRESSAGVVQARIAALAGVGLALSFALAAGELPLALSLPTLALTVLLLWLSPSAATGRIGRFGVQRAWDVHGYNELQEWRLAGEHFRFRVDDRWFAVALPASKHAQLEAELELHAPDRRSPYR
jgi:hypothetical protein